MNTLPELEELRAKADELGIEYAKTLGRAKLLEKIEAFEAERLKPKRKKKVEARPLSDTDIKVLKAKSLAKVKITNLDPNNTGASTVVSGVMNEYMPIQRVLPLGVEMAVEEALIKEISNRKHITSIPEQDASGSFTGNHKTIEAPSFAVVRL